MPGSFDIASFDPDVFDALAFELSGGASGMAAFADSSFDVGAFSVDAFWITESEPPAEGEIIGDSSQTFALTGSATGVVEDAGAPPTPGTGDWLNFYIKKKRG